MSSFRGGGGGSLPATPVSGNRTSSVSGGFSPPGSGGYGSGSADRSNSLFSGVSVMPQNNQFRNQIEPTEVIDLQDEGEGDGGNNGGDNGGELDFMADFVHTPWGEVARMPMGFKVHVVLATLLCFGSFFGILICLQRTFKFLFCILAFHFTASPSPMQAFQWWLYPWFFFAMTLSIHKYYAKANYWTGTVVGLLVFHSILFLLNKQITPDVDWYWYPVLVSLMVGMYKYYSIDPSAGKLQLYSYLYVVLCLMLVITWLNLQRITVFPWFVYPVALLALPLLFTYMFSIYHERRLYLYSGVFTLSLSLICMVSWSFLTPAPDLLSSPNNNNSTTTPYSPTSRTPSFNFAPLNIPFFWFFVPPCIGFVVTLVLFYVHRRKSVGGTSDASAGDRSTV